MLAQYLFKSVVEQMRSGVIGSRRFALVGVDACHEMGCRVFGELFYYVNALIVFAFGVDNLYCFVLAHENALVAYLSAHLTIERCVI